MNLGTVPADFALPVVTEAVAKRQIVFVVTEAEFHTLTLLVKFGEFVMNGVRRERAESSLPGKLAEAIAGMQHSEAQEDIELAIRSSVGVMEQGELGMYGLAFLGDLEPEDLGPELRADAADLSLFVIPAAVAC